MILIDLTHVDIFKDVVIDFNEYGYKYLLGIEFCVFE